MEKAKDTAMPHMFTVQALDKLPGLFMPRRYLYHCMRCKWSFVVNDGRRGALRPIADGITPLTHDEAVARAATFAAGPCPAMRVVAEANIRLNDNGSNGHALAEHSTHHEIRSSRLSARNYWQVR